MSTPMTPPAHLLLVEDDNDLRLALRSTLCRAHFEVTAVTRAEEGLAALQNTPVDLVVSDIRLPGMTGLALLEHLRKHSGHPPVVLMTAYADAALRLPHTEQACAEVLCLPVHPGLELADVDRVAREVIRWASAP